MFYLKWVVSIFKDRLIFVKCLWFVRWLALWVDLLQWQNWLKFRWSLLSFVIRNKNGGEKRTRSKVPKRIRSIRHGRLWRGIWSVWYWWRWYYIHNRVKKSTSMLWKESHGWRCITHTDKAFKSWWEWRHRLWWIQTHNGRLIFRAWVRWRDKISLLSFW